MNYIPILKASSYYLEDVLGLRLDDRSKNGKISFILLNQPPVCDAHCRRCFMPEDRRVLDTQKVLSLDESKQVLDKAKEYGALCLEISGEGEPTLNHNLLQLIEYANNLSYLTTLITNGHSLTSKQIQAYRDSNVTLVFSHYSLNPHIYEIDNNTPGSFERKMHNLVTAKDIFSDTVEEVNGYKVYRLAIHATLQKDNIQDALDLKDYCHDNGIFFSIAPLAQTGCAVEHPEMKLEETVKMECERIPLMKVPNILGDNSIIHSHSSLREVGREVCGTCYYGLNIGYDGAILFDAHAGYEVGNMFGNIKDTDFSEIIKIQKEMSRRLFENIRGFCPVRDPDWHSFLKEVLDKSKEREKGTLG